METKKTTKQPAKKKPPAKKNTKSKTQPKTQPKNNVNAEEVQEKRGKGQPRSFASGKALEDKMKEYLEYCIKNEQLANIAGFSVYCDITKDTFYQQQVYYSDSFKKCNDMLENAAVNHKTVAMAIFYLKNKFGYKDKLETENLNLNVNTETEMSQEEADNILKGFGINFECNTNTKQK